MYAYFGLSEASRNREIQERVQRRLIVSIPAIIQDAIGFITLFQAAQLWDLFSVQTCDVPIHGAGSKLQQTATRHVANEVATQNQVYRSLYVVLQRRKISSKITIDTCHHPNVLFQASCLHSPAWRERPIKYWCKPKFPPKTQPHVQLTTDAVRGSSWIAACTSVRSRFWTPTSGYLADFHVARARIALRANGPRSKCYRSCWIELPCWRCRRFCPCKGCEWQDCGVVNGVGMKCVEAWCINARQIWLGIYCKFWIGLRSKNDTLGIRVFTWSQYLALDLYNLSSNGLSYNKYGSAL